MSNLANLEEIGALAFQGNQIRKIKLPVYITTERLVFDISTRSNTNLTSIINPSGKSFDWSSITWQGTSDTFTFATGTCGSVKIKAN